MHKKILVTLDGSELSEAVLPQVEELVSGTQAQVTLLRVVEEVHASGGTHSSLEVAGDPAYRFGIPRRTVPEGEMGRADQQAAEAAENTVKAHLEEKADHLRSAGIRVDTATCISQDPVQAILDYVQDQDVNLIMMATHGRTGLGRLLVGSVAGAVVERSGRPVVLVRPAAFS